MGEDQTHMPYLDSVSETGVPASAREAAALHTSSFLLVPGLSRKIFSGEHHRWDY